MSFLENQFETSVGNSSTWGMSPWLSMLTHGEYWGPPDTQWNVDPSQIYQAKESGEIGGLLLRDDLRKERFSDIDRIGATGFAVSGIGKGPSLIDQYYTDMGEVYQETDAAITDVYEIYGSASESTLADISSVGGFSTEFGGGSGDITDIYTELEEDYSNWENWPGTTSVSDPGGFSEQLENCVEAQLGSMELSSPNDIFTAVEACKQEAL